MSRVQLALNVSDVDEAVAFYSKLFQAEPAKRRPGYANFAIAEPPLKLVLIENPEAAATLNHLGIEVFSTDEVAAAQARLAGEGLATATEDNVSCCYAVQDKVWVDDPDHVGVRESVADATGRPTCETARTCSTRTASSMSTRAVPCASTSNCSLTGDTSASSAASGIAIRDTRCRSWCRPAPSRSR